MVGQMPVLILSITHCDSRIIDPNGPHSLIWVQSQPSAIEAQRTTITPRKRRK